MTDEAERTEVDGRLATLQALRATKARAQVDRRAAWARIIAAGVSGLAVSALTAAAGEIAFAACFLVATLVVGVMPMAMLAHRPNAMGDGPHDGLSVGELDTEIAALGADLEGVLPPPAAMSVVEDPRDGALTVDEA